MSSDLTPGDAAESADATRRTLLATERTQLAWWRTGLTAIAVALAVGRVVPELDDSSVQWPYTVLGVAFAVYAIALIWYGNLRAAAVDRAVALGGYASSHPRISTALGLAGATLCAATAILIVAS